MYNDVQWFCNICPGKRKRAITNKKFFRGVGFGPEMDQIDTNMGAFKMRFQ